MFDKKEIIQIAVVTLILSALLSVRNFGLFPYALSALFAVIAVNVVSKKMASYYFEADAEVKIWEIYKYGWIGVFSAGIMHPSKNFRKPFQIGAFLPVILSVFSLGYFTWLGSLVFDVKAKVSRTAKRHGLYSFSEMTDEHLAYIAAAGIFMNLVFGIIGYLIGSTWFLLFAKLNVYYSFFNMIPMSDLDGNKIFFGEFVLWCFLEALVMIGIGYVFLVV